MKTALFTGAGASSAIGYPLTSEFLPRVRAGIKDGSLFKKLKEDAKSEQKDREELREYLCRLYQGFDRSADCELPLITDVFSLVEYSILNGEALPMGGERSLRRFRDLLKQAITDVLIGDWEKDWDKNDPEQRKQETTLERLTAWMMELGSEIALVTTNYDIGLEWGIYQHDSNRRKVYRTIDLGCDWRHIRSGRERTRPSGDHRLRIYKLHGSLDQLRCVNCGYIYFNPWGSIAHTPFREKLDPTNTCHCRDDLRLELNIVAPSFVREIRDPNLLNVWRSALEWMRTAERWVIVGYSLPPEDLAIRSLLVRAYDGADPKPEITVAQKGNGAKARYKLIFPDCTYLKGGLEGFLTNRSEHGRRGRR